MRKIVIVGGGAGGLELATKLGRKLGRKNKAAISLVDRNRTHLWKPLLHEVAAGSIDTGIDSLSYRAHGTNNGFQFQLGDLVALDRENKTITLGAMLDDEGQEVLRPREIDFDILVFAIGSQSNDFGTPGVSDFCFYIDSQEQAQRFHYKLLNKIAAVG